MLLRSWLMLYALYHLLSMQVSRAYPFTGFDAPEAEAVAGRAFAAGLATIQRKKLSGPHAHYRVQFSMPLRLHPFSDMSELHSGDGRCIVLLES